MADKASALLARAGVARTDGRPRVKSLTAAVARAFSSAVATRAHWLVPLVIGLLLGRATVLGTMKPFGTAYVIALAAVGLRGRALMATAGAMVGAATSPPLAAGVESFPVLMVAWCVTAAAGRFSRLSAPTIAMGALLGIASLRVVAAAFSGDDFVLAAVATGADLLSLVILFPFVDLSVARPTELSRGQIASVLIVLGLLVLGTEGIYVYGYSVTELLMRVGVLGAAAVGGIGVGAAAGTTMGMLSMLGGGGLLAGGVTAGGLTVDGLTVGGLTVGGMTWSAPLLSTAGLLAGLGAQIGRSGSSGKARGFDRPASPGQARGFGRPGAFVGLLTAHLLMSPYAPDGEAIGEALTYCLAAGGLIALVPRSSFSWMARRVPDTPDAHRARQERRRQAESAARRQLYRVADVLDKVGQVLARSRQSAARRGEGGFDQFVLDVSERVCAGCTRHAACWDAYVYQTYRDLLTTAAAVSTSGTARPADLPEGLRQRCIKPEHLAGGVTRLLAALRVAADANDPKGGSTGRTADSTIDRASGGPTSRTNDRMSGGATSTTHERTSSGTTGRTNSRTSGGTSGGTSGANDGANGGINGGINGGAIGGTGIGTNDVADGGAHGSVAAGTDHGGTLSDSELYNAAPRQFAGIAAILSGVADHLEAIDVASTGGRRNGDKSARGHDLVRGDNSVHGRVAARGSRPPRYRLVVDAAQAVGDGSAVSGDCFRRVDLDDHRVVLIVSDGMGSGARAAAESEAAVTMLEQFLLEGFDLPFAVQTINSVLLLRSADETFATLDVCMFDLSDGTVHMMKTGAAPTFIRRGRHVDIVRADSLPVGILHAVEAATIEYRLGEGDLVVMVSDGVLEIIASRGDKAEAVGRALRRLERGDAHEAVDSLFKRAQAGGDQGVPDDVTVVAAQFVAL